MREKWGKNKYKHLIIIIAGILDIVCMVRMMQPGLIYYYENEELERPVSGLWFEENIIDENDAGWYVDNSMEYDKVFVQTPFVDLKPGSYDITINYRAQGEGSTYSVDIGEARDFYELGSRKGKLDGGHVGKSFSGWYFQEIKNFQVKTTYGGAGYLLVSNISIEQNRDMERCILFMLIFFLASYFIYCKVKENEKQRKIILVGLGVALAAFLPYMMPYIYGADDLSFHLLRIEGMAEGVKCGQCPVKIQPQWLNGYGYPVSVFYSDGILWVAGLLRLIGFPLQTAYKMYVFLINGFTYAIAVFSFKRIVKDEQIAVIGAIIYTLAPYRLMNIYVRSAVGEYTAITFLPLILAGVYEILMYNKVKRKYSWFILTAGMTGIIQSHILTCEIVFFILLFTCLICWRKTFELLRFLEFVKAVGATLLVNIGFIVPFLDYMREDFLINSEKFDGLIQENGILASQIFSFLPGINTDYAIGFVFVLGLFLYWWDGKQERKHKETELYLEKYSCYLGIFLLFMSTSMFPWDRLSKLNPIFEELISKLQFPWRVLGAVGLFLTVLLCLILRRWKKDKAREEVLALMICIVGIVGITAGVFLSSQSRKGDSVSIPDVEAISTFKVGAGEYIPEGVDYSVINMPEGKLWNYGNINIKNWNKEGTNFIVECSNTGEAGAIELPMLYYRGFRAEDKDKNLDVAIEAGENGRIRLLIPEGYEGKISVFFKEFWYWRVAELISVLTIISGIVCGMVFEIQDTNKRINIVEKKSSCQKGKE